jgi:hypothetical protein
MLQIYEKISENNEIMKQKIIIISSTKILEKWHFFLIFFLEKWQKKYNFALEKRKHYA